MFKLVFILASAISLIACGIPLQQRAINHAVIVVAAYTQYAKFTELFLKNRPEELGLELTKNRVKQFLKDPDAAQFRNVRYVEFKSEGRLVCGEYNAKNSYGAFVGYQLFIGSPEAVSTIQTNPYHEITKTTENEALRVVCSS